VTARLGTGGPANTFDRPGGEIVFQPGKQRLMPMAAGPPRAASSMKTCSALAGRAYFQTPHKSTGRDSVRPKTT